MLNFNPQVQSDKYDKFLNNGRIDLRIPTSGPMSMYDKIPAKQCPTYRDALEGIWTKSLLEQVYFSSQNQQIIQNAVRAAIYQKTGGREIAQCDCDELSTVMRSIYLQYSRNLPDHITEQVEDLNRKVISDIVQRVYSETIGYLNYLRDISTLVTPLAAPVSTNYKNKELEFKGWFS